tara:strand:- start:152 stop:409 length:258 start_codon:yes stop_codon:yes gene_type:complete
MNYYSIVPEDIYLERSSLFGGLIGFKDRESAIEYNEVEGSSCKNPLLIEIIDSSGFRVLEYGKCYILIGNLDKDNHRVSSLDDKL